MICDFLTSLRHKTEGFTNPALAMEKFQSEPLKYDLVITDLRMPEMDGIDVLKKCHTLSPDLPVIIVTAFGTINNAVEATKLGAYSYIPKPFKLDDLELGVARALGYKHLKDQNRDLKNQITINQNKFGIIGKSKAIQEVFELIGQVAGTTANILITGESGTGKERVARAIHENSNRKTKKMVAVNCTALPDTLLESELFGHIKGSFTGATTDKIGLFEEADGGTLFLDEIGDLDISLQSKILRAIQEKEIKPIGSVKTKTIDVRLISATHKDLRKAIENELFREDLFYRLSVIPIRVPSLRERKEDIPLLVEHFVKKSNLLNGRSVKGLNEEAMSKLMNYRWEGNVRELENLIERVVILAKSDVITPNDLPSENSADPESFLSVQAGHWPTLDEIENKYIRAVLEKTGGNKERAAQILGINRRTLYRKDL